MVQPVQFLQMVPAVQLNLVDLEVLDLQLLLDHHLPLVIQLVQKVLWVPGCLETQLDLENPEDRYCQLTQLDLIKENNQNYLSVTYILNF